MLFQVGFLICVLSIVFGFVLEGGNLVVLIHAQYAILMLCGSSLGILIASSPINILKALMASLRKLKKLGAFSKKDYEEVLVFMYFYFRFLKVTSVQDIERVIENPTESSLFNSFNIVRTNKEISTFFCDYTRMIINGYNNSFELENMMDNHINIKKEHTHDVSMALYRLGEAMPALGIVIAVLGMVNVMSSFDKSPEVLGAKIATALLGTFVGIAGAYCIINPIASFLQNFGNDEAKILECIKAGFIAHAKDTPISLSVEFARQATVEGYKPHFNELELAIEEKRKNFKEIAAKGQQNH